MAPSGIAVALVGSTGLVGANILQTLLSHPTTSTVSTFTRRSLTGISDPHSRLRPQIAPDSSTWPSDFSTFHPTPALFISALGTTRAAAGGFEAQCKIDYDLNLALARAARDAGVRVYVLISAASSSSKSWSGYMQMKGELEEAVSGLGFEKTVIVRPGLITGGKRVDSRPAEYVIRVVADFMGSISGGYLKDFWAQDADVIGRAAVQAGVMSLDGQAPPGKIWNLGQGEIIRLGRTEWAG